MHDMPFCLRLWLSPDHIEILRDQIDEMIECGDGEVSQMARTVMSQLPLRREGTFKVTLSGVDGSRRTKVFDNIEEAQTFAQDYVGQRPELGRGYAVSDDGVGKVEAFGFPLIDLFPELKAERSGAA